MLKLIFEREIMRRSKLQYLIEALDDEEGIKSHSAIERSQSLEKEVARLRAELSSVRLQVVQPRRLCLCRLQA